MNPVREQIRLFNNQDFYLLRDDCLSIPKRLWEDTVYPSAFEVTSDHYEWKRPWEMNENAQFTMADRYKTPIRFDLSKTRLRKKDNLTNFQQNLASISALTLHPWLFRIVVPDDQNFNDSKYAGIFHFRFWKFGKWYDVVVDDRLPTKGGKLLSHLESDHPDEFWLMLMEKAFVKFFGQEDPFTKNACGEMLVDITGGVPESWKSYDKGQWDTDFPDIGSIICSSLERESIIICRQFTNNHLNPSTENTPPRATYCITKAFNLNEGKSNHILVIRFFNPFKTESEDWNGSWSKTSKQWESVSSSRKIKLGLVCEHDGEFWMPLYECVKNDWIVDVVNLNPNYVKSWMEQPIKIKCWYASTLEGKWVKGVTNGGLLSEKPNDFKINPQYHLSLKTTDNRQPFCTIIISLLQKTTVKSRVNIFYYIYPIGPENTPLDTDFFQNNSPLLEFHTPELTKLREVGKRHALPPDDYCIVCATQSKSEVSFLLRVFTEKESELNVMDEGIAIKELDPRVSIRSSGISGDKLRLSDESVHSFFEMVSDKNHVIGWKGLKNVLNYALNHEKPTPKNKYLVRKSFISYVFPSSSVFDTMDSKEFSKDVARTLLAMADLDQTGKLTYEEFQGLWDDIRQLIRVYEIHSNEYGYMTKNELRDAIDSAGYKLSNNILCNLAIRYSNKDDQIPFDDFLMCISKLKTIFEYFKMKDRDDTNKAIFSFEEYIQKAIYA